MARLPQFHYLSYQAAKELVEYFEESNTKFPKWLKVPDFFLPSRNISFVISNSVGGGINCNKIRWWWVFDTFKLCWLGGGEKKDKIVLVVPPFSSSVPPPPDAFFPGTALI